MNKLPFTVLDSFLGTGKTTFLNHVLYYKRSLSVTENVNDMSEVNHYALLVKNENTITITLRNKMVLQEKEIFQSSC